jgi:hypothetical protein
MKIRRTEFFWMPASKYKNKRDQTCNSNREITSYTYNRLAPDLQFSLQKDLYSQEITTFRRHELAPYASSLHENKKISIWGV